MHYRSTHGTRCHRIRKDELDFFRGQELGAHQPLDGERRRLGDDILLRWG